jgi:hypothetical protein
MHATMPIAGYWHANRSPQSTIFQTDSPGERMNIEPSLSRLPVVLVTESRREYCTLIKSILEAQGYEVLITQSSVEGILQALEYPGEIGWLITNLVPSRYHNGVELAACFHTFWPQAEVIFLGRSPEPDEEKAWKKTIGHFRFVQDHPAPDDLMGLLDPRQPVCRTNPFERMP